MAISSVAPPSEAVAHARSRDVVRHFAHLLRRKGLLERRYGYYAAKICLRAARS